MPDLTRRKIPAGDEAYHHGDLRNATLAAALALLRETGNPTFTLRDIARRLGVSHTAPYAHFADRGAVLEAVAANGFERLTSALTAAGDSGGDATERFVEMGRAYVRFGLGEPALYRLMFGIPRDEGPQWKPETDIVGARAFACLVDAIAALQRVAVVHAGDPQRIALTVWAVVHGTTSLLIDRRTPFAPDSPEALTCFANDCLRMTLAGLRPSASPPRDTRALT